MSAAGALSAPREPIEARVLNAVYLLFGVGFFGLLVWQQLDPDGPRDYFDRAREQVNERRRYARAMRQTLDDIDSLPELDELDHERDGDAV
jgi:hypothetical protein